MEIYDVENLTIVGIGEKPAQLLGPFKHDEVFTFHNVQNIVFDHLEIGHTPELDDCRGGVLFFQKSKNLHINNTVLFGSGNTGLILSEVVGLDFTNSSITGCTEGIMTLSKSSHLRFEHARFFDNKGGIHIEDCSDVSFLRCHIYDNYAQYGDHLFSIRASANITISYSRIYDNMFALLLDISSSLQVRIEKSTITQNKTRYFVSGDLQELLCVFEHNEFRQGKYKTSTSWYECVRDQQPEDPQFEIIREPQEEHSTFVEQAEIIKISVSGDTPFPIGTFEDMGSGADRLWGIDIDSIRVHKLAGTPDLLHVEWVNFEHGQGVYQDCYYHVCLMNTPGVTLLKGGISLSGHWGWDEGFLQGEYQITYQEQRLIITTKGGTWHLSDSPQVGFHKDESGMYARTVETQLIREYKIQDTRLSLSKAIMLYHVQEGDSFERICQDLAVKSSWISSEKLPMRGEWLQIIIPNDAAEERYPAIQSYE